MSNFKDQNNTSNNALFSALRSKLAREVCGSAMLADLLQKVNGMEQAQDEFVGRAEEYSTAIRPFFPDLVGLLPDRQAARAARITG
jgi:hypothetical protein